MQMKIVDSRKRDNGRLDALPDAIYKIEQLPDGKFRVWSPVNSPVLLCWET